MLAVSVMGIDLKDLVSLCIPFSGLGGRPEQGMNRMNHDRTKAVGATGSAVKRESMQVHLKLLIGNFLLLLCFLFPRPALGATLSL